MYSRIIRQQNRTRNAGETLAGTASNHSGDSKRANRASVAQRSEGLRRIVDYRYACFAQSAFDSSDGCRSAKEVRDDHALGV